MKKRLLKRLSIFVLFLCSFSIKSVVNWPDSPGNIVNNSVENDDINIVDDCIINGGGTGQISVSVTSAHIPDAITVTVPAGAARTIEGRAGGESDLYFYAAESKSIFFDINDDLTFQGSPAPGSHNMLVTFSGLGTLVFRLADGTTVSFTSDGDSGGTKFFVRMYRAIGGVIFSRQNESSNDDVEIIVGPKSLISYMATQPASTSPDGEIGRIQFQPINNTNYLGKMIVHIQDTGGLYIGGNLVQDIPYPQLADIDLNMPAGTRADLSIGGTGDEYARLLVINANKTFTDLSIDPWFVGAPVINRYGFVIGTTGALIAFNFAYLDYVGLSNNICLEPDIPDQILMGRSVSSVIKKRNPSALIIDGHIDTDGNPARINIQQSAIYLRSGVDRHGTVSPDFIVSPMERTSGEGEILLDVEGPASITGVDTNSLEILSLEVTPTGGSILIDSDETLFPSRTFAKDGNGDYLAYNKGAFLINNRISLLNTYLVHTDANHVVCENNDLISEPTYIGGESFALDPEDNWPRPTIEFLNAYFYIHTSVALTGLDLLVPNGAATPNISSFTFFGNGYKKDNGSGRNMILGTQIGSTACDTCTVINRNAHLDILQTSTMPSSLDHKLYLETSCNNDKIWDDLQFVCGPCQDEPSIHTLYLGNASNISIGSQSQTWDPATNPTLNIAGNYFSFATRGGLQCCPELSAVTGQGGIFVDQYGTITIDRCFRANVSTMVVKSGNGEVDLPPSNVFFNNKVGITKAPLDLATDTIIVDKGEKISDYTINWLELEKDYGTFCPYVVSCVPECYCPVITTSNLENVPTVKGEIGQLQIQGSRFANPVHVKADGGHIREFVFLPSCNSGEASAAVIILKNDAEVGLGSTHVNKDSLNASVVLGINGITIIAEAGEGEVDNDGRINLNQDIEINNMCHILTGPKFGTGQERDFTLRIYSDTPRKIVVKKGGVLNLCSFTQPNQIVEIGGEVTLVLEPGAKVMLNDGTLRVTDKAAIVCTQTEDLDQLTNPISVSSTDDIRVKFVGTGTVEFREGSTMAIDKWAYVGIETDDCINTTSLVFAITEQAQCMVGGYEAEGGVLQVGNTTDKENSSISFTLLINGEEATFTIGRHAFFGLGVGVADNTPAAQNDWLVGNLYNTKEINILMPNGALAHNQTYAGSDDKASLFAIADFQDVLFTFLFDTIKSTILGGGNIALINSQDAPYSLINPVVETTDFNYPYADIPEPPFVLPGIMSSKSFLKDMFGIHKVQLDNTGLGLYGYLKVLYDQGCSSILATAGPNDNNKTIVGYVTQGTIMRPEINSILSRRGTDIDHEFSQRVGIVGVRLNDDIPRGVMQAFELPADVDPVTVVASVVLGGIFLVAAAGVIIWNVALGLMILSGGHPL